MRFLRGEAREVGKVIFLQMALDAYRQDFVDVLEESGSNIKFLVGDEHFNVGLRTRVKSKIVEQTGRNYFFLGRRLGFQSRCVRRAIEADAAIVEINPRNLTTWSVLVARSLLRRKTAGWGHAHSRVGARFTSDLVRKIMYGLCHRVVLYTEREVESLSHTVSESKLLAANNSMYRRNRLSPSSVGHGRRNDLLMIGRLTREKAPVDAIQCFFNVIDSLPDSHLHVVGDGELARECHKAVSDMGLADRVIFHGHQTELAVLEPLFRRSSAVVSSGTAGLNVVQALGFGTAVVLPTADRHGPEVAALPDDMSFYFDRTDPTGLETAMSKSVITPPSYAAREAAAELIYREYTAERMAETFLVVERELA